MCLRLKGLKVSEKKKRKKENLLRPWFEMQLSPKWLQSYLIAWLDFSSNQQAVSSFISLFFCLVLKFTDAVLFAQDKQKTGRCRSYSVNFSLANFSVQLLPYASLPSSICGKLDYHFLGRLVQETDIGVI